MTTMKEIRLFMPIVECNDKIQDYVSEHGTEIADELLNLLTDLDWRII
jgi:hypothetical protein